MTDINPAVGVDLGTTNTVVAVQTDSMGPVILEIPQPTDERKHLENLPQIKSAVFFETENTATVGTFANNRRESFRSIKSHMGTRWNAKHPKTEKFLRPPHINAHILKLAHQTIINKFPDWDQAALITVPSSFNTDQRNDTILSAELAGFRNIRLLDEPTAAFYYYFNQNRESGDFERDQNILVFDFGGGTLDVSIIYVENQGDQMVLDAIGRSRYNNLGGNDIDLELAAFMLGCWEYENDTEVTSSPKNLRENLYKLFIEKSSQFKEETEDILKYDSIIPEFFIIEEIYGGEDSKEINFRKQLSLNQYNNITSKFLQPKSNLNIYRPIEEAISIANKINSDFSREKLNLILYTGGASNMASVQMALQSHFAGKHCFSIDEDEACSTVALGAASCRYDEMYGKQKVQMRSQLLESVLTRLPSDRNYTTIVPLECEPSEKFSKIEGNFQLHRPTIRLKLPLFRGVSSNDQQLSPMRDLEIPIRKVLEEGTSYKIYYRMTENKTILLKVIFEGPEGPIEEIADIDLFDDRTELKPKFQLCKVNQV